MRKEPLCTFEKFCTENGAVPADVVSQLSLGLENTLGGTFLFTSLTGKNVVQL